MGGAPPDSQPRAEPKREQEYRTMFQIPVNVAFIGLPGGSEWIVLLIFGLLIFGKRLPDVGKSLGRSIVEFKKGLKSIAADIEKAVEHDQKDMLPPPETPKRTETSEPVAHTNSGTSH